MNYILISFNKYKVLFSIILGILAIIGLFLPLYIGIIDMYGLAGWKLKFFPIFGIHRESLGLLTPVVNIIGDIFNLIPPPNIILTIIGFTMLILSVSIIVFGIIEAKKRESITFPILIIFIAVILLILLTLDYSISMRVGISKEITHPNYYISFNKSIFIAYLEDLIVIIPRKRKFLYGVGYYLIIITQVIVLVIYFIDIIIIISKKKKAKT
jgi:hypothetical protein